MPVQSTTGTESANWLFELLRTIATGRPGVTVAQFVHQNFPQRSIIARIAGRNDSLPIVILGAHQDSINSLNPANVRERAPHQARLSPARSRPRVSQGGGCRGHP